MASFNDVAREIISNHTKVNNEIFKNVVEYIKFENLKEDINHIPC